MVCCLVAGFVVWLVEDRRPQHHSDDTPSERHDVSKQKRSPARMVQLANWCCGRSHNPATSCRKLHIASWVSFATVTGAAYHTPKTTISRLFVIVWSFVALVVVSTYQANLTAFMTVKAVDKRVHNILELLESGKKVLYFWIDPPRRRSVDLFTYLNISLQTRPPFWPLLAMIGCRSSLSLDVNVGLPS